MIDEKKTVALILAQLGDKDGVTIGFGPTEEVELTPEEQLHAVAGELVEAVKCGDVAAVAEALRGAFLLVDSMPHVEGEHVEETPEEEEPEEPGHAAEPVSHEVRERLSGWVEPGGEDAEEYAFGGRARKKYARGGMVKRYADGGTVAPYGPAWLRELTAPGASTMTQSDQALRAALARR